MNLMRGEILEQPSVIDALIRLEADRVRSTAAALRRLDVRYVVIAARGSSDNAARYGQYAFGSLLGLPVALATPSLFTLYNRPPQMHQALVIGISQSGQSEDIVAVLAEARRQRVPSLAITNSPDSPLAAEADYLIETHAGIERSTPATKTYTSQLVALGLLVAGWLDAPELIRQLRALPSLIQSALELEAALAEAAQRYRGAAYCVVLGRGYNYGTAFEIALKLKETCYLAAEPYSPADFLHGPVALVESGFPAIIIAPSGATAASLFQFAEDLKGRGASVLMISDLAEASRLADLPLRLPPLDAEWVSPMVTIIPGQLFSMHLAQARGLDPDRPRGLQKVTVTR